MKARHAHCPTHDRPLTCPACAAARAGAVTSPAKTRAARLNAQRPRRDPAVLARVARLVARFAADYPATVGYDAPGYVADRLQVSRLQAKRLIAAVEASA